jgi:excisionase family DNA binding protein
MKNLLTTKQASKLLGVTPLRVRHFIWEGRLPAEKIGRDYFIKEQDLKKFTTWKAEEKITT